MKNKLSMQKQWLNVVSKPRIVKTGIAVFLTAWLCQLLEWPVIFAVISAIVSVEPTVHASIRKGIVRLPAAAIGAFFAMFFNFVLADSPLTYSISAVLTIYVCHLLRWHQALVVATLTAVNMIEIVEGQWFIDFLVRLGTTSIGIIVSTCINFLIFPPNFTKPIVAQCAKLNMDTKNLLDKVMDYHLYRKGNLQALRKLSDSNFKLIEKTYELIRFQKEEYRYRHVHKNDLKMIYQCGHQLDDFEKINHHIADMMFFSSRNQEWDQSELESLEHIRTMIVEVFRSGHVQETEFQQCFSTLIALLHHHMNQSSADHIEPVASLTFELLAICVVLRKKQTELKKNEDDEQSSRVPEATREDR